MGHQIYGMFKNVCKEVDALQGGLIDIVMMNAMNDMNNVVPSMGTATATPSSQQQNQNKQQNNSKSNKTPREESPETSHVQLHANPLGSMFDSRTSSQSSSSD